MLCIPLDVPGQQGSRSTDELPISIRIKHILFLEYSFCYMMCRLAVGIVPAGSEIFRPAGHRYAFHSI